jgi:hypothetical protein
MKIQLQVFLVVTPCSVAVGYHRLIFRMSSLICPQTQLDMETSASSLIGRCRAPPKKSKNGRLPLCCFIQTLVSFDHKSEEKKTFSLLLFKQCGAVIAQSV